VTQLRDTQGIISKTNKLNIKYQITITNNKSNNIKVELFDNLPKSNESSVKVKLLEPEIPEARPSSTKEAKVASGDSTDTWTNVSITAANNLHWKISIPSNGKKEIPFSYTIDYPIDVELCNAY